MICRARISTLEGILERKASVTHGGKSITSRHPMQSWNVQRTSRSGITPQSGGTTFLRRGCYLRLCGHSQPLANTKLDGILLEAMPRAASLEGSRRSRRLCEIPARSLQPSGRRREWYWASLFEDDRLVLFRHTAVHNVAVSVPLHQCVESLL